MATATTLRDLRRDLRRRPRGLILLLCCFFMGCSSPPSVVPLLRVAGLALADETRLVEDEAARSSQQTKQTLAALDAAFEADLDQTGELTPQWVMDATRAYAAARDAVLANDAQQQLNRARRTDNLHAALEAQQRAISLIERRDELVTQTIGEGGWSLGRLILAAPISTPTPTGAER